jgi:anti-sigma factor RsiW
MNCQAARALMLTVELPELRGSTDTELSQHLAACSRCRSHAELLLAAHRELGQALSAESGTMPAPHAVVAAAERRRARLRQVRRLAPLAVAAALAGLLVLRRPTAPGGPLFVPTPEAVPRQVTVTAPPGRNVAVLHGISTNVVVIWFF